MAKRKAENRTFLDRWETEYLFTYVKDRPVCLVCGANVLVTKEYNIRRHYETKHQDKYKDLDTTKVNLFNLGPRPRSVFEFDTTALEQL